MVTLADMITSALKHHKIKLFCLILLGVFTARPAVYAQPKWQLKDVAKIEFIMSGHIGMDYYEKFTVKNEAGVWKSYRTFLIDSYKNIKENNDTVFQAKVSTRDIKKLLERASGTVPSTDTMKMPKPPRKLLAQYIDSIDKQGQYHLSRERCQYYIKMARSKQFVKRARRWAISAKGWNHAFILLISKHNDTTMFYGNPSVLSYAWTVNEIRSCDNQIGVIFNKATGRQPFTELGKYYGEVYKTLFMLMFANENKKIVWRKLN